MLVTSIFAFSHNVFYSIKKRKYHLSNTYFVVCKCFQFGPVQTDVIWYLKSVQPQSACRLQMYNIYNLELSNILLSCIQLRLSISKQSRVSTILKNSLSFSRKLCKFESKSDWLNRMVKPIRSCATFKCFYI